PAAKPCDELWREYSPPDAGCAFRAPPRSLVPATPQSDPPSSRGAPERNRRKSPAIRANKEAAPKVASFDGCTPNNIPLTRSSEANAQIGRMVKRNGNRPRDRTILCSVFNHGIRFEKYDKNPVSVVP